MMQTKTISLPETMWEFVEEQVGSEGYGSASEYLRDLVRADQKRHAKTQLEQVLLSAMGSGDGGGLTRRDGRGDDRERRGGAGGASERIAELAWRKKDGFFGAMGSQPEKPSFPLRPGLPHSLRSLRRGAAGRLRCGERSGTGGQGPESCMLQSLSCWVAVEYLFW